MYYLPTSCLIFLFLVFLSHPLPCASSKQEHGWCEALFQCGNITAGFPFWGGNRHEHCGHPSLKLHCNKNNSATLIILDQEYSVLHLNHTSYTLTLARRDHLGSFCSSNFTNIILPPNIFELSSTYENLTVFYQCESFHPYLPSDTCPNKGFISVSDNPGYHETCHDNFTVNVPKSFVLKEEERDVAHLESSLKKGFEVKVKIDAKACEKCLSSHRRCGFNEYLPSEVKCGPLPPQTGISPGAKIGLGVCVILFVLLVITSFLQILRKRKRKTSHDMTQQNLKTLNPQHDLKALITLKQYSYANVKRITKSFTEVVGKGGFGTVYRGTLCDGRSVAVKILKDSKGNNGEDFVNEVASMSQTSHVNIVSLLGFCSEGSKRAILYEFLENGSLDKFISGKRSSNMDWMALYKIALGVARGLEYLHHGCRTRIVHFDIKPQNVLLDDNLCPKVSDFGLAKLCERKESILSLLDARGTIGYIAPEVFSGVYGRVSHKSDVYSYGMLVLEMIGARTRTSTEDTSSSASSMYFPEWIYRDLEKGDNGRLIEDGINSEEEEIAKKMTLVGLWCIQSWPSNRPPMNRVVEMLEGNMNALELPPKPVLQIPAGHLQESSMTSNDISGYKKSVP